MALPILPVAARIARVSQSRLAQPPPEVNGMAESQGDWYASLFASYAHASRFEQLPEATVHEIKRRVLDSIGVAMAAFDEDAPTVARAYALELPHPAGATLWGTGARVTPEAASLANGVMVRYLDFNDTYLSREPLHPSDVIPGLMALCQWRDRPVRDLVAGVAVAYEIGVALCDSVSLRSRGWDHVNYIAVAAACGAGTLLGLTPSQIEHAISIATVPHASMRQTRAGELSMWKGAAAANSTRNAVFAALLAEKGFTGPFQPFQGEMGFLRQLLQVDDFDSAPFQPLEGGAPPSRILDSYIKRWPVEYHAQSAVDIAVDLRQQLGASDSADAVAGAVQSLHIDTFGAAYEIIAMDQEKWAPRTRETADHSMPYIVAVALLDGFVDSGSFSDERLVDPRVRSILDRSTLRMDPELDKGYPEGIPNRITLTAADGRKLVGEQSYPRGHFHNRMSDAEVEAKLLSNVEGRWSEAQSRRVIDLVMSLERQSSLDALLSAMAENAAG